MIAVTYWCNASGAPSCAHGASCNFALTLSVPSAPNARAEKAYALRPTRFVVVNGPDLGLVPAVRMTLNPATIAGATALSAGYNAGLAAAVAGLSGLPGINITLVDLFGTLHDIVDNPGDYGLTNVTDMCITPGVKGNAKCSNPDDYLFWDGIHPTTAGHAIVADLIGRRYRAR